MIASLWIFLGLLAAVFGGGAILGGGAVYLVMTRRDIADEPGQLEPAALVDPPRPQIKMDRPTLAPGKSTFEYRPAHPHYPGTPERPIDRNGWPITKPIRDTKHPYYDPRAFAPEPSWESPTEEFGRLEARLLELAPALAVSIAKSERAVDELLASGALARPEWVGAR